MLKLSQLFFRQTALLFIGVFLLGAVAGYVLLRQMEIETHATMLRHTLQVLEGDLQNRSPSEFDRRIGKIREETGIRITVMDAGGTVRFETDRDPHEMENHGKRPEILQAREEEWGRSVRYSRTVGKELLYVAHNTGTEFVRLAYPLDAISAQLFSLWLKALLFLAGVMGLLFWLSLRMHRKVDRDVKKIRSALERLLRKEYDHAPAPIGCCRELEEIGQLLRKVAKKLAKRERQKAKHTRKLKELTRRQGDIISAIGHEFKNPVAAIMGYAQSLEEQEDLDPGIRRRFLEKIGRNAQKISQMIDRLSLAVRLENKSFRPRLRRFLLNETVRQVVETLAHKYPDRKIRLECKPVEIEADRDMIEHVLLNLTENALKYSEEEVVIRCDRSRLEVIDQGIGIEEKDLEKITKRFYRVQGLEWNNSIGVGLYIVKYILRLHNTELEIRSRLKKGSIFGFTLEQMRPRILPLSKEREMDSQPSSSPKMVK